MKILLLILYIIIIFIVSRFYYRNVLFESFHNRPLIALKNPDLFGRLIIFFHIGLAIFLIAYFKWYYILIQLIFWYLYAKFYFNNAVKQIQNERKISEEAAIYEVKSRMRHPSS